MEKLVLNLPSMYGDHHVLAVRDVLTTMEGIDEIYASAAWKQVMISFDSSKLEQEGIEKALADAGYPVGDGEPQMLVTANDIKRDPQWAVFGVRVSQTNDADLTMSGEFRRY